MLGECIILVHSVSLQPNVTDYWRWQLDPSAGYTVRGSYKLLTAQDTLQVAHAADLIWHKQVPLKVSIFVCRLLRDRGIITNVDTGCLVGCGHRETSQHLFIFCDFYGCLW